MNKLLATCVDDLFITSPATPGSFGNLLTMTSPLGGIVIPGVDVGRPLSVGGSATG